MMDGGEDKRLQHQEETLCHGGPSFVVDAPSNYKHVQQLLWLAPNIHIFEDSMGAESEQL